MSYSCTIFVRKSQQKNLVQRFVPSFLGPVFYEDTITFVRNPHTLDFAKQIVGWQVPRLKANNSSNLISRDREPAYWGNTSRSHSQDMLKDATLVPELQQRSKGRREE